jgi:peptidoglycan hydrolase-like protein with peptidoglycan-binding domain
MKSFGKYFGWFLMAVVAMAIIWYFFLRKKANAATIPDQLETKDVRDSFPLKRGSSGDRVRNLQAVLNALLDSDQVPVSAMAKPAKLIIDGQFGPLTENLVIYFFGAKQVDQEKYYNLTGGV